MLLSFFNLLYLFEIQHILNIIAFTNPIIVFKKTGYEPLFLCI